MTGRLIVIEGPDGVGKSTLARLVSATLGSRGEKVISTSFPGNDAGTLGKTIYEIHHRPGTFGVKSVSPLAGQALHIAAHLDALDFHIRGELAAGTTIVLDRFWWSTWVYGRATGCDEKTLDALIHAERVAWGRLLPNPLVLVSRETPLPVANSAPTEKRLIQLYQQLSDQEKAKHPILRISNDGTPEEAAASIVAEIS